MGSTPLVHTNIGRARGCNMLASNVTTGEVVSCWNYFNETFRFIKNNSGSFKQWTMIYKKINIDLYDLTSARCCAICPDIDYKIQSPYYSVHYISMDPRVLLMLRLLNALLFTPSMKFLVANYNIKCTHIISSCRFDLQKRDFPS